jgi:predicted DNA-binding transcriptional regulator AlpA
MTAKITNAIGSTPVVERFVSPNEFSRRSSYSRSGLYRLVKVGLLSPPVRLGPGRVGWPEQIMLDWLAERAPAPQSAA